ncbi:signal peptidase I [Caulobacter hibisci]|uniref:Signal peptidase I n=1 Tax=Caulobacter hibisci TaxID=2035993 RepID=A0ABS0SVT6_9CAUL|nr:signal peptidase I [Caulobacter hibisci]MBI1683757.1 signal peptidase I [Caulobacter hibisci]
MTRASLRSSVIDWAKTLAVTAAIVFVPRTVLCQPFTIPSGSMEPTLLVGDYILVNKFAYGWSRHSAPLSPALGHGRLMGREPARGDVVVFKKPGDGRTDVIKRLVGLPGDELQVVDGLLRINGAPVEQRPMGTRLEETPFGVRPAERFAETLPGGRTHLINSYGPRTPAGNTAAYRVPEGCYFMMGDNRDNSLDSRFDPGPIPAGEARCAWNPALSANLPAQTGMGFVPFENLVGRAEMVLFSWEAGAGLRENRAFQRL